jgi:hypothetical protein
MSVGGAKDAFVEPALTGTAVISDVQFAQFHTPYCESDNKESQWKINKRRRWEFGECCANPSTKQRAETAALEGRAAHRPKQRTKRKPKKA